MKKYTIEDLIYFAGFFDGEGTAAITKISSHNNSYDPIFSLANSDINVLNWIKEKFGGKIYVHQLKGEFTAISSSTWKVCYSSKDNYTWRLGSNYILALLHDLIPYIKVKKNKCLILLEFLTNRRTDFRGSCGRPSWYINWEENMYKKMKLIDNCDILIDKCNTNNNIIRNNSNLFDYEDLSKL